ncbi:hypothetical protein ACS0TY_026803 [Phlomoides rotata]
MLTPKPLSLYHRELIPEDELQTMKFPSTTEVNPREHCKAIALRSGTHYEGPSMPQEKDREGRYEEQESKEEEFIIVDVKDAIEEEVEEEIKEEPK